LQTPRGSGSSTWRSFLDRSEPSRVIRRQNKNMSRKVERIGYLIGILLLVSGLIHVGILVLSGASWMGPLSLRKPATFGLSFGLTLLTITWVSSFLRLGNRARTLLLSVFASACVLETALISLQAWRGVPSHFNIETPFDAFVTQMLAAGGVILVAIIAALTFISFRATPATPAGMRVAIRTGLAVLLGAMVSGALMIARGMSLVFGGNAQAAYLTGGSLKPTHAVTMHAVLLLPALAWLLSLTEWSEPRQLRVILVAATGYVVFAAAVAAGNLAGVF